MSSAERDDYVIAACPCGKGNIIKHVVSWDNPWSGADTSYHIDCQRCDSEWTIDSSGATLTQRSSEQAARRALDDFISAREKLNEYLRPFVTRYLVGRSPTSKKAEHALLRELNIYSEALQKLTDHIRLVLNPPPGTNVVHLHQR